MPDPNIITASVSPNPQNALTLSALRYFLRRNLWIIGLCAIALGTLTMFGVAVAVPVSYQASATLVVVPPSFASDLKPPTLTIQGYQQLLESDAVVFETKRRLVDASAIPRETVLRIGSGLSTRIFVSRRSEETELAPMVRALASANSASLAAEIANTWASVFLESTRELTAGTTTTTIGFLEEQYPLSKSRLAESEKARVATANRYQETLDATVTTWDQRITEARNQHYEAVAAYRAETHEILSTHMAETNLETVAKQLEALRKTFSDLQQEQASVESMVEQRQLESEAGRAQLSQTQPYLDLSKAITDDALWRTVTSSSKDSVDWEELQNRALVTQEINPVYTGLASIVAKIEMDLRALQPRARQLEERLKRLALQLQTLERDFRMDEAMRERLSQEREAGLEVLMESGQLRIAVMERDRSRAAQAIVRERDARLSQLNRDIDQQKTLHEDLAKNYSQALLAKAQPDIEDVRLAARAVAPERPASRHIAMKGLLGAMFGALIGVVVGILREPWPPSSSESAT